jgi:hypothetical protein
MLNRMLEEKRRVLYLCNAFIFVMGARLGGFPLCHFVAADHSPGLVPPEVLS